MDKEIDGLGGSLPWSLLKRLSRQGLEPAAQNS